MNINKDEYLQSERIFEMQNEYLKDKIEIEVQNKEGRE